MMSLRIGFDIDGVLADFFSSFLEMAAHVLPLADGASLADLDAFSEGDRHKVWKEIIHTPNWWLRLSPYEPAEIARLYQLSRERKWEVFFMTTRVEIAGDSVQFQTQWWLEAQGFFLPSVVTVPGSRGDLANALRIDLLVDDQMLNCAEVIGASKSKALLMHRTPQSSVREQATNAGIGVVESLAEAIEVLELLDELGPDRRRSLTKLTDWLPRRKPSRAKPVLPMDPRELRPPAGIEGPQE